MKQFWEYSGHVLRQFLDIVGVVDVILLIVALLTSIHFESLLPVWLWVIVFALSLYVGTFRVYAQSTVSQEKAMEACSELFLAFDRWWARIKDYESRFVTSAMGRPSLNEVLPIEYLPDDEVAAQMENFRVSKIKVWPFLDEEVKAAFSQAEDVFLGYLASFYGDIWGHEVFGDQVPTEAMRNERLERIVFSDAPHRSYSECKEAYQRLESQLMS
jgi:hypothetical protein